MRVQDIKCYALFHLNAHILVDHRFVHFVFVFTYSDMTYFYVYRRLVPNPNLDCVK